MMMMGGMVAIWLILIVVVLAVRVIGPLLAGRGWQSTLPDGQQRGPEALARDRYARGEIGSPEYQEVLINLLKDRYVRGELELAEYEERASRVLDEVVPARKEVSAQLEAPTAVEEGRAIR